MLDFVRIACHDVKELASESDATNIHFSSL